MLLPDQLAWASAAGVSWCAGLQGSSPAQTVPGKLTKRVGGVEKCGKAAVRGGVGTSRIQLGKATSGESRVLGEVVQPRRTCRQRQQRDYCQYDRVCWCEARRGAVVSVWCAITEFIASGCLGNVSGFKKYLNKCAEDGHWFSWWHSFLEAVCFYWKRNIFIPLSLPMWFICVSAVGRYRRQVRAWQTFCLMRWRHCC